MSPVAASAAERRAAEIARDLRIHVREEPIRVWARRWPGAGWLRWVRWPRRVPATHCRCGMPWPCWARRAAVAWIARRRVGIDG